MSLTDASLASHFRTVFGRDPSVVVAVNDAGRAAGVSANTLVRAASEVLGGKGGGKDDVAQGGGSDVSRTGEALAAVRRALTEGRAGR